MQQFLLPGATAYERKSLEIDRQALSVHHEVRLVEVRDAGSITSGIAHLYGPPGIDQALARSLRVPYVANGTVQPSRLRWWRTPPRPRLTPLRESGGGGLFVPEAVEEPYFAVRNSPAGPVVGSFGRAAITAQVEQVMARIDRFRDDVTWRVFDHPPFPDELSTLAAWVDPAADEADFDGFVAEALVAGVAVVATRTRINTQRLENGRCGFLVPPRDPNEMTHAILTALFKPELSRPKSEAARQTAGKYSPCQRERVLEQIYESMIE